MFRKALVFTRGKCFVLNRKAGKCVTFLDGRLSIVCESKSLEESVFIIIGKVFDKISV